MDRAKKLYIVVRNNLEPGLQMAQATHAITDAIFKFPEQTKNWRDTSNYVVILAAHDEAHLLKIARKLKRKKVKIALFLEPDIEMEATALAALPSEQTADILSNLPLALRRKR